MKPSVRVLIQGVRLQHPALNVWGGQGAADGLLCGVEHVTQCGLQPQQNSSHVNATKLIMM